MKILILSCNTGGGHNSAAYAMREYFDLIFAKCEIRDALAFRSEIKSKVISRGHVFVYKNAPQLFGAGYRYLEHHPSKQGHPSVMYESVKNDSEELYDFLRENPFDLIICTHIFAAMLTTEMKKKYAMPIKSYLIITDYACYPGIHEVDVDRIFIPHSSLIAEYEENGVARERLSVSGIPVRACFYQKESARDAKRALGLDENKRMVLMMCGSMGCGPLPALAESIGMELPKDAILTVICGNNAKLYEKLQKMSLPDAVRIVGFTDRISLYMDAAEVVLTKPGGLSATEAVTKGLPMVLIDAVPGCESKNRDFLVENGYAVTADTVDDLSRVARTLLFDLERQKMMILRQREAFSSYAAKTIGDVILSDCQER